MKCLYVYFITVAVISAAVPQDLCEICVPTQNCPLFEILNVRDQLKWMEKFPCGPPPKNDYFEVPAGFTSAAKGDYVCCSNDILRIEKPEHFEGQIGHKSRIDLVQSYSNPEKSYDKYILFHDNSKPPNSPKNEEFNNYYYNKYNVTKKPQNSNNYYDNINPSNNDVDDYNSNGNNNYDTNQSPPHNSSGTLWFPDRRQNYDNTDYWQAHKSENSETGNERTHWNDKLDRQEGNTEITQRTLENEARPPNQYDPPGNVARPPGQFNPPEIEARPPLEYNPPRNENRPPIRYDPPRNEDRPPILNNPPGKDDRSHTLYNPPENEGRPPTQYYPPENEAKPPNQFDPPRNEARPPIEYYPPGNENRPPIQYDPPRNEARPPIRYNPPGNVVRPPIQYDTPGRPPIQNMPPEYGMARPPQNYDPEDMYRVPNPYYSLGHLRPPNEYYPSEDSGPFDHYFPPMNMGRPPYFPPNNNNNFMPGPPYTNYPWEPNYNYRRNRRNTNSHHPNNGNPHAGHLYNSYNKNINKGNFGGGQCSLTSFPPDPQSDCCGRQLADDDRITGWGNNNRPVFTNNWGGTPRAGPWRNKRSISENEANVTVENRIAGGHATEPYQYPWTVLLLTTFDYGRREAAFTCGGGLISAKYVLTAGHCVNDNSAAVKSVQVTLAEYDKNSFPKDCYATRNGRRCVDNVAMYAEEVITHPQYDNENLVNDIALLRLRGSVPYTEYIRPICLPTINIDEPQFSNLQFEVAGWGRIGAYSSNIKQSTVLHLVNHSECKRYYPQLTNKHLCAAGKRGEDTCKGDSGGPLMVLYRGRYYVAGVVSGKRADSPCGTTVPSLYTNVYHYVNWIRSIIRY